MISYKLEFEEWGVKMIEHALAIENKIQEAAKKIEAVLGSSCQIGIILGSGLTDFVDELENKTSLSYTEIPNFPTTSVSGHGDRLTTGYLGEKKILVMEGRFHYYEGYEMSQVIFPIRVMQRLGVKTLIITNSAGGINPSLYKGKLLLIKDHINFMGASPLRGANLPEWGERFPDMTNVYTPALRDLAKRVAAEEGIDLAEGVYTALAGPNYETPAEVRFFGMIGSDVVGMSTVPEAIAASQLGMDILGISRVSNMAAGNGEGPLNHMDVLQRSSEERTKFVRLLKAIIHAM